MIVYHGSQNNNLELEERPIYLTDDKAEATEWAKGYMFDYDLFETDNPTLYTMEVTFNNPLEIHTEDEYYEYMESTSTNIPKLADMGYDGVVLYPDEDFGGTNYFMPLNAKAQCKILEKEELGNPKRKNESLIERLTYLTEAGYNWSKGMSNNAVNAYENSERPISKWNKRDLLKTFEMELSNISDYTKDLYADVLKNPQELLGKLKKLPLKELRDILLTKSSYHHTSKYYNITDFYKLNIEYALDIIYHDYPELYTDKDFKENYNGSRKMNLLDRLKALTEDLDDTLKFHDTLNPKLWNGMDLKPEVVSKLDEIVGLFKEYLDIPEDAIVDVQITGSSANYNYTPYSDLDVHLIVDYDKVHEDCPLVNGYLWSMKNNFNREHDITIYDVPVELYAENANEGAVSNGIYSLKSNDWIKQPEKIEPLKDDKAVKAKYNEIQDTVDKTEDSEVARELLSKIYAMRKSGLAEGGELSTENLAFKMLRNSQAIDKLREIIRANIDKNLSLESEDEVASGEIESEEDNGSYLS